ncbi:MAG: creatininase family protein [Candidatus Bathyarchaeota archaeon]|jgi:creatinine amidohydrolase
MLNKMSWTEAKAYFTRKNIVIVPVGSNEQHGPQNPLGTDHLIAEAIALETAKRTRILCMPFVPYGVSAHHKQFYGTISVSPKNFRRYVKDVCLSLNYYGVHKIVVVNGHGGNRAALLELGRDLRRKDVFLSVFQWWEAANKVLPDLFTSDEQGHAAAEETSVNLALHPEYVNVDRAVNEQPSKLKVKVEGVSLPMDTVDYTSSGVFGDSKEASAEKGRLVFEAVVKKLVQHVKLVEQTNIKDLMPKSKIL